MEQDKHCLEESAHETYLKDALGNVIVFPHQASIPSAGTSSWFSLENHPPVILQQYAVGASS